MISYKQYIAHLYSFQKEIQKNKPIHLCIKRQLQIKDIFLRNFYTNLLQKQTPKQQIIQEIKKKIAFLQSFSYKITTQLEYFLPKRSHILILFPDALIMEIISFIKKPTFFYLPHSFSKKIQQKNIIFFQEKALFYSKLFDYVVISPDFFYKKNTLSFTYEHLKQIPFIFLTTQEFTLPFIHSQEYKHFIQYTPKIKIITEKGIFSPQTFYEEIKHTNYNS